MLNCMTRPSVSISKNRRRINSVVHDFFVLFPLNCELLVGSTVVYQATAWKKTLFCHFLTPVIMFYMKYFQKTTVVNRFAFKSHIQNLTCQVQLCNSMTLMIDDSNFGEVLLPGCKTFRAHNSSISPRWFRCINDYGLEAIHNSFWILLWLFQPHSFVRGRVAICCMMRAQKRLPF